MTNPVYVDLHIHTSENPGNLNKDYNIKKLIDNIKVHSKNSDFLISLTDHNTINKEVYEKLSDITPYFLLGVELHIRNYPKENLYHAHIYFNLENPISEIDTINSILDKIYPNKIVTKNDDKVPFINDIIREFDKYDFILLPHGGQNHSTFDDSIPKDVNFDSTLERTIYYNQFDGFTARGTSGVEKTLSYFKKLNISEFINLLTGSDNYNPEIYPEPKANESASNYVSTWMFAKPTFNGVRLSLSEKNRLVYSNQKPEINEQIIKSSNIANDLLDIDVSYTNGLNVIIGESSAGKSLLMDSLYRKINNITSESKYSDFGIENLIIENPYNFKPHYINQNFIIDKINNRKIGEIEIINLLFPSNKELRQEVEQKLHELQTIISSLVQCVAEIESTIDQINKKSIFTKLIYQEKVVENPANLFIIKTEDDNAIAISSIDYKKYTQTLDDLLSLSNTNPYINDIGKEIEKIKTEINNAYCKYNFSKTIQSKMQTFKNDIDIEIKSKNGKNAIKKSEKESLLKLLKLYMTEKNNFEIYLEKLLDFDYKIETQKVPCGGHTLSIVNEFKITKETILSIINKFIISTVRIEDLSELQPFTLFKKNFSQKPKVSSYDDLANKIYKDFSESNKETYLIKTKEGNDFDKLSPGWKTGVILDLIFSNDKDNAPLLIDQPEDNLASSYLNMDLISAIHKEKKRRQIIIISHNATIPMLGDAQNVIICQNISNKITIRNASLEDIHNNKPVVDYVAELTDGGKTSIKKRFKKYNFKKYKGDDENDN